MFLMQLHAFNIGERLKFALYRFCYCLYALFYFKQSRIHQVIDDKRFYLKDIFASVVIITLIIRVIITIFLQSNDCMNVAYSWVVFNMQTHPLFCVALRSNCTEQVLFWFICQLYANYAILVCYANAKKLGIQSSTYSRMNATSRWVSQ